jgi:cytochrome b
MLNRGQTALHGAVLFGYDDVIKDMMARNANINATDGRPDQAIPGGCASGASALRTTQLDTESMTNEKRLVWDLPLRLFHWLLVTSMIASYVTAKLGFDWMQWHFYLGYWTIGLLVFRVLWGVFGPKHARFGSFIRNPSAIWLYMKSLFHRDSVRSIGHNPVGGLMVILMLALVAVQATTGLFTTDDVVWAGPYNPSVSSSTASTLSSIHSINFNIILGVVCLHIAAIIFYGLYKRQNLIVPMLHGHLPSTMVPEHEAISSSQLIKAVVVSLVAAGFVYWLLAHAPVVADNTY